MTNLDILDDEGRAFLREIVYSDSPTKENEALWIYGLYEKFPGTTMVVEEPLVELPVFDPNVQERWELWE